MASGLTISNLLYGILAGMKEGIDALSQTGPSEGQRMNKNSYLPFTRNAWPLEQHSQAAPISQMIL